MRILREGVTYENVNLKAVGNTIVDGHVIAQHGVLSAHPRCIAIDTNGDDITVYKTVVIDGGEEQVPDVQPVEDITEYDAEGVEVVPLVFVNENVSFAEEPRPDSSWLVVDIKLWLDAQGVEYTSSMLKADLLALV